MHTELPIFFFHQGANKSLFFSKVLQQAALSNRRENIYVLTDSHFHLFKQYNCIDIAKYSYGTIAFDKVYQHHSQNKFAFEKACFDRWFIINAIVKDLGIKYFFHADCDVVILEDLNPIYEHISKGNYDGSVMFFENDLGNSITSGHSSFWTSGLLDRFCNFVHEKYLDHKGFNALLEQTLEGKFFDNKNMSDMILLDAFRKEVRPATLNLFTLEDKYICFDFNINVAYNGLKASFKLVPFFKIKKMRRKKDGLYALVFNGDTTTDHHKFYTLHFQGYLTKTLIPLYLYPENKYKLLENKISGILIYAVRAMKLLKNKVKGKYRNIISG